MHTDLKKQNLSKRQVELISKASRGVWYYEQYFRMAIHEDKMAGRYMSRKGGKVTK